jgi:Nucleoside 2-deoxyribosyltransferase
MCAGCAPTGDAELRSARSCWAGIIAPALVGPVACAAVRLYIAGPLFSEAERSWLDQLAARLRSEGFDCFVPHENFAKLVDVTLEEVYRIDAEGLRSANALVAWLDGTMVDDGTACEIGMFAELVRSGGHYRGIVGIATDLRLERRRQQNVVGGGMNLFVGGAIESCGKIVHSVDDVAAALREL